MSYIEGGELWNLIISSKFWYCICGWYLQTHRHSSLRSPIIRGISRLKFVYLNLTSYFSFYSDNPCFQGPETFYTWKLSEKRYLLEYYLFYEPTILLQSDNYPNDQLFCVCRYDARSEFVKLITINI